MAVARQAFGRTIHDIARQTIDELITASYAFEWTLRLVKIEATPAFYAFIFVIAYSAISSTGGLSARFLRTILALFV